MENVQSPYTLLERTSRQCTTAEWIERLRTCDVPVMPVCGLSGVKHDSNLPAVGLFQQRYSLTVGEHVALRHPVRFSTMRQEWQQPAPGLGGHSAKVLREVGLSDVEIDAAVR